MIVIDGEQNCQTVFEDNKISACRVYASCISDYKTFILEIMVISKNRLEVMHNFSYNNPNELSKQIEKITEKLPHLQIKYD